MLIHVRPIAVTLAVISFFGLNFVCLFYGLSPLTCCKRAFIGAILIYLATAITVNILNAVLTRAIIDSHINKSKGT